MVSPAPEKIRSILTRKSPTSKRHSGKGQVVGHFDANEIQQIERFKIEFCNLHGITGSDFDEMVQHAARERNPPFPHSDLISKHDFWKSIYEVIPNRERRSVYRFMRRHFQSSTQKPHEWTPEQDDELVELYHEHGPKFAYIASILGRNDDDVVQRWKNRLQHRGTMVRGSWTNEEVAELRQLIQEAYTILKASGQNVGADIYEMDERMVSWGAISDKLHNRRSRQQCGDKWRKLRRGILYEREMKAERAQREARDLQHSPDSNNKNSRRYLSTFYVHSGDEDEGNLDESPSNDKAETAPPDRDEHEAPIRNGKKESPAPSKTPTLQPKPDPDANSDSDSGESSSEAESGSGKSSSGSDSDSGSDEGSHTSMEPSTSQSTKHKQLDAQKTQEPTKHSAGTKSKLASNVSRRDITREKPAEKGANATTAPKKSNHSSQDKGSSSDSSSESDEDDSEDDDLESAAQNQGSKQNKSLSTKPQLQLFDDEAGAEGSADEESDDASSDESEGGSENEDESENQSESEGENGSDMDLQLPPKPEPKMLAKASTQEETSSKPRHSLLKQLKNDFQPQKPSPFNKKPAPAKDSSSSSDDTESSSESSSDNSNDSSSEDESKKPAKKASPVQAKSLPQVSSLKKAASDARNANTPKSGTASKPKPAPSSNESDEDDPAKPIVKYPRTINGPKFQDSSLKQLKKQFASPQGVKPQDKAAEKPAPNDSDSDDSDEDSSSSSNDDSESEDESKPTPPKQEPSAQDPPIKHRSSSSGSSESDSDSSSGSGSESEHESKPNTTASPSNQSTDQSSKRKRSSTSAASTSASASTSTRPSATRNIKLEPESSESDTKPTVKKGRVQSPKQNAQVKQRQSSSESESDSDSSSS